MGIPKAYSISNIKTENGFEIFYECPVCQAIFKVFKNDIKKSIRDKYCYHCGEKLNWTTTSVYCDSEIGHLYHNNIEESKQIISAINFFNEKRYFDLYNIKE